ncbi:MAG: hypothetical protein Q4E22_00305 [Coriobacteriia bacterium]|nr:hypothetical protein [Coriobacteriia bacterium]
MALQLYGIKNYRNAKLAIATILKSSLERYQNSYLVFDGYYTEEFLLAEIEEGFKVQSFSKLGFLAFLSNLIHSEKLLTNKQEINHLVNSYLKKRQLEHDKILAYKLKSLALRYDPYDEEISLPQDDMHELRELARFAHDLNCRLPYQDLNELKIPDNSQLIFLSSAKLDDAFHLFLNKHKDTCAIEVISLDPEAHIANAVFENAYSEYKELASQVVSIEQDEPFTSNELKLINKHLYSSTINLKAQRDFHLILAHGRESLVYAAAKQANEYIQEGLNIGIALSESSYLKRLLQELELNGLEARNLFGEDLLHSNLFSIVISTIKFIYLESYEDFLGFVRYLDAKTTQNLLDLYFYSEPPQIISALTKELEAINQDAYKVLRETRAILSEVDDVVQEDIHKLLEDFRQLLGKKEEDFVVQKILEKTLWRSVKLAQTFKTNVDMEELIQVLESLKLHEDSNDAQVTIFDGTIPLFEDFDSLIVLDLNAESYPSFKPNQALEIYLDQHGLPALSDFSLERKLDFHHLLARGKQKLCLMKNDITRNGTGLQSSLFLNEVLDLYLSDEESEKTKEVPENLYEAGVVIEFSDSDLARVSPSASQISRSKKIMMQNGEA